MADLAGTHQFGPGSGQVLVKTGSEGLAARAGHDLTLETTRWPARIMVPVGDTSEPVSLLGSAFIRQNGSA